MWKKKNQLQDQTTNLLKNYKYRSSSVTPLITNKKHNKSKWWSLWRDTAKLWRGSLKSVWSREGDRSYEGGAMWSVSSRYEALSREQKIIDILQDNGQRNCCLGLHEQ